MWAGAAGSPAIHGGFPWENSPGRGRAAVGSVPRAGWGLGDLSPPPGALCSPPKGAGMPGGALLLRVFCISCRAAPPRDQRSCAGTPGAGCDTHACSSCGAREQRHRTGEARCGAQQTGESASATPQPCASCSCCPSWGFLRFLLALLNLPPLAGGVMW